MRKLLISFSLGFIVLALLFAFMKQRESSRINATVSNGLSQSGDDSELTSILEAQTTQELSIVIQPLHVASVSPQPAQAVLP
jgi:hypothetical protein